MTKQQDTPTVSSAAHILDSADAKHPEAIRSDRRDILLRNFWMNGTNAVVDVRMTDVDAASYDNMTTEKCLGSGEHLVKLFGN